MMQKALLGVKTLLEEVAHWRHAFERTFHVPQTLPISTFKLP